MPWVIGVCGGVGEELFECFAVFDCHAFVVKGEFGVFFVEALEFAFGGSVENEEYDDKDKEQSEKEFKEHGR